jgi:hypothetical protein
MDPDRTRFGRLEVVLLKKTRVVISMDKKVVDRREVHYAKLRRPEWWMFAVLKMEAWLSWLSWPDAWLGFRGRFDLFSGDRAL